MAKCVRSIAAVLSCAVAIAGGVARAQSRDVEAGRSAFETASFDAAEALFERALEDPSASGAALVEAHRYLSALRLAVGNSAAAEMHAEAALALDPTAQPPTGAPPGLVAIFDRVRASRGGARPRTTLTLPASLPARRASSVRAGAQDVPAGLFARLTVRCMSGGITVASRSVDVGPGGGNVEAPLAPLAPRAALACSATLTTRAGALIARAEASGRASNESDPRVRPETPRGVSPLLLAGGIGAGAVALTTIATLIVVAVARPAEARIGAPRLEP